MRVYYEDFQRNFGVCLGSRCRVRVKEVLPRRFIPLILCRFGQFCSKGSPCLIIARRLQHSYLPRRFVACCAVTGCVIYMPSASQAQEGLQALLSLELWAIGYFDLTAIQAPPPPQIWCTPQNLFQNVFQTIWNKKKFFLVQNDPKNLVVFRDGLT